jgi:hypothetical protein
VGGQATTDNQNVEEMQQAKEEKRTAACASFGMAMSVGFHFSRFGQFQMR